MQGAPEWATFQGNAAHTGYVPVTIDPNQFATRWQLAVPTFLYFNGLFNLATDVRAPNFVRCCGFFLLGRNVFGGIDGKHKTGFCRLTGSPFKLTFMIRTRSNLVTS